MIHCVHIINIGTNHRNYMMVISCHKLKHKEQQQYKIQENTPEKKHNDVQSQYSTITIIILIKNIDHYTQIPIYI